MQRFSHSIAWCFVIGGLVLLFGNPSWFPERYDLGFMGVGALLLALAIWGFGKLFSAYEPKTQKALHRLQAAFALSVALSGLGTLGLWQLYKVGFEYDKLIHLLFPGIIVATASQYFALHYNIPLQKSIWRTGWLLLFLCIGWEFFEYYGDKVFGTEMFGMYDQAVRRDTILDMIANLTSIKIGALVARRFQIHGSR